MTCRTLSIAATSAKKLAESTGVAHAFFLSPGGVPTVCLAAEFHSSEVVRFRRVLPSGVTATIVPPGAPG